MTLFVYRFDLAFTRQVWTEFFRRGNVFAFQCALAILKHQRTTLLSLNGDELMCQLSSNQLCGSLPVSLVDQACDIELSHRIESIATELGVESPVPIRRARDTSTMDDRDPQLISPQRSASYSSLTSLSPTTPPPGPSMHLLAAISPVRSSARKRRQPQQQREDSDDDSGDELSLPVSQSFFITDASPAKDRPAASSAPRAILSRARTVL